jgi:predicted RNase H-like HicB family nuclease
MPDVVFERSGRWWVAELPSFRGAYSQGRTKAEAYRNLLDALRELVDSYAEDKPRSATG